MTALGSIPKVFSQSGLNLVDGSLLVYLIVRSLLVPLEVFAFRIPSTLCAVPVIIVDAPKLGHWIFNADWTESIVPVLCPFPGSAMSIWAIVVRFIKSLFIFVLMF